MDPSLHSGAGRVVGLGDAGIEIVLHCPRLPRYDEKIFTTRTERHSGGVIANTLCALSRLGTPSTFLGCIGSDATGAQVRQSLESFGVDLGQLIVRQGEDTFFCINLLDPTGEKALVVAATDTMFPAPEEVDERALASATWLHTTGLRVDTTLKAIALAKARGLSVSLDLEPSTLRHGRHAVREMLSGTDLLFVNRQALRELSQDSQEAEAAAALLAWGPKVVVLTRGDRGSIVVTGSGRLEVPAFVVEVRDTTGAGDCHNAAFIHGYLQGWPLDRVAVFAAAAAAISITAVGSQSALPTQPDVQAFLDRSGRTDNRTTGADNRSSAWTT